MARIHDYPKTLEEHYIRRLRTTLAVRRERIAQVRTRQDAQKYVERVRGLLRLAFGRPPAPAEPKARTVRASEVDGRSVEHVLFESQPGMLVSANLYLPAGRADAAPGIVFPCGHSPAGKAYPLYVEACIRLAREGYVTLIYDPINQGERDIFRPLGREDLPTRDSPCDGHNIIGRQLHAAGEWFGQWRLLDGIRAVDYLASRPEVDADLLGVAGQSGGGTMSAYLWAMEPRLKMVASSCWATSYLNDLENGMPADEEQYPPMMFAGELDKMDCFLARAGEPALLLGKEHDFFDDRALRSGFAELLRLHELLGATPETCRLDISPGTHSLDGPSQRSMLAFFNHVAGRPAPAPDRSIEVPSETDLAVTSGLDVSTEGSRPVYEIVAERAHAAAAKRMEITSSKVPEVVAHALNIHVPRRAPHCRRLFQTSRTRECTGQQVHRFIVEADQNVPSVLRHVCRDVEPFRLSPRERALLYLPDIDSQSDLESPDTMSGEDDFWTLDVRGLGEGLHSMQDPFTLYGHDYMLGGYALMYNETQLGGRLRDVLATVRLLREEGAGEVHITGRRQGAILALLAGVIDRDVASVNSIDAPESILAMATAPFTFWPAVNLPHAVLTRFDLPQVRVALGERLVTDTRADAERFEPL